MYDLYWIVPLVLAGFVGCGVRTIARFGQSTRIWPVMECTVLRLYSFHCNGTRATCVPVLVVGAHGLTRVHLALPQTLCADSYCGVWGVCVQVELEDDETSKQRSSMDDEYARAGVRDPKVCVTTSRDPSSRLKQFAKELKLVVPNAQRINRGNHKVRVVQIAGYLACHNSNGRVTSGFY